MKTFILFKINEVTDALENMLYWLSSAWLKAMTPTILQFITVQKITASTVSHSNTTERSYYRENVCKESPVE